MGLRIYNDWEGLCMLKSKSKVILIRCNFPSGTQMKISAKIKNIGQN